MNLKSSENQLDLILKYLNLTLNYQIIKIIQEYISLNNDLENIKETNTLSESEIDFLKFQIKELENSRLKIGEKEILSQNLNY